MATIQLRARCGNAASHAVPLPSDYFVEEERGSASWSDDAQALYNATPETRLQALTEQQNTMRWAPYLNEALASFSSHLFALAVQLDPCFQQLPPSLRHGFRQLPSPFATFQKGQKLS